MRIVRTENRDTAAGDLRRDPGQDGSDAIEPPNIAPIVVALCADEAQDITGQCFFVFGGAACLLRPWDAGELFPREARWESAEFLARLWERFPDGLAPEGMVALMEKAGGRSLQVR